MKMATDFELILELVRENGLERENSTARRNQI